MFPLKKKCGLFLILLFATILATSVLAEMAYFYWYDAAGTECYEDKLGEVPGNTDYSSIAPLHTPKCCDLEGNVQAEICVLRDTWHCTAKRNTYNVNWDTDITDCTCYGKTWLPGRFFESNQPICCGDDANEHYVTQGVGQPACCSKKTDACVALSGRCRYQDGKETSCHDGQDNDCDLKIDCADDNCKTGTEEGKCRDKIDNDCDGLTDCSDTDCGESLDCIGCPPEICSGGKDDDCDNYIDCVDSDCVNSEVCPCKPTIEVCAGGKDEDCDGKIDCKDEDCFESCGGGSTCVAENQEAGNCDNGKDDDCDGFTDHKDNGCPGCPMGTKLCADGSCKESCDSQACITANGVCDEGEGCSCEDCLGKRDSCDRELVCDSNAKTCKCPSGTTMCSDGRCRTKCFVCGDGIVEAGEECDGGATTCPGSCTGGQVTCKDDCTWDTSGCSGCQQCKPEDVDGYCCVIPGDTKCDSECTANADTDCTGENACTSYPEDCCKDSKDGKCDPDCIIYKDPDCSESCSSKKDNCCNAKSGNGCDPDCDTGVDPDCDATCSNTQGNCCNNNKEDPSVCDPDCIQGVDPDCKCGNGIIDTGETCDSTNLDGKTCGGFFPGYGGVLSCLDADEEHPCHFDTSGCFEQPGTCTGGSCGFGKDCRCPECVGQQNGCNYGAICDATARCACIDGTTLCKDNTCRLSQNCQLYGGGEKLCLTPEDGGTNACDPGEGCGCPECEDKKGPCNDLSVCKDSMCIGCFLKKVYWSNIKTGQAEECIGNGNEIKLIAEGSSGCEGKTATFKLFKGGSEVTLPSNKAEFKNSKAGINWKAETEAGEEETSYYFDASSDEEETIRSEPLKVEYCVKECDADCDQYCEYDTENCKKAALPGKPEGSYCTKLEGSGSLEERSVKVDANTMTGWCETCNEYGLSKGQETCAKYYDCTPGWWEKEGIPYPGPGDATTAKNALEWSDCGEPKVEIYPGDWSRQKVEGDMRNRLICPEKDASGNTMSKYKCCDGQSNCYCKVPDKEALKKTKGLDCNIVELRPTEVKACLSEEKFSFFTNMNILIVVLILTGFYIWKTRTVNKNITKKTRKARTKK